MKTNRLDARMQDKLLTFQALKMLNSEIRNTVIYKMNWKCAEYLEKKFGE